MTMMSPFRLQCVHTNSLLSFLIRGLCYVICFGIVPPTAASHVGERRSSSGRLSAVDASLAWARPDGVSSCAAEEFEEASLLQTASFVHAGVHGRASVSIATVDAATAHTAAASSGTPVVALAAALSDVYAHLSSTGMRLKQAVLYQSKSRGHFAHKTAHASTHPPAEFLQSAQFYEWCCFFIALLAFVFFHLYSCNFVLPWRFLGLWLLTSALYMFLIWGRLGGDVAIDWLVGWFIEFFFSLENIFVYHVIVKSVGTPPYLCRFVLFLVVLCQVVFQAGFFMGLGQILSECNVLPFLLGVWLLYLSFASYQECRAPEHDATERQNTALYTLAVSCCGPRFVDEPRASTFFTTTNDKRLGVTVLVPLFLVILGVDFCMEIDSTMTKIESFPNAYISFTSSALAAFCVPELFFVAVALFRRFALLKYAVVFVLFYFAVDLLTEEFFAIPALVGLIIQLTAMALCIIVSWWFGFTCIPEKEGREATCWCGASFLPDSEVCIVCCSYREDGAFPINWRCGCIDSTDVVKHPPNADLGNNTDVSTAVSLVGSDGSNSRDGGDEPQPALSDHASSGAQPSTGLSVSKGYRRWACSRNTQQEQDSVRSLRAHRQHPQQGSSASSQQPSSRSNQEQLNKEDTEEHIGIINPAA